MILQIFQLVVQQLGPALLYDLLSYAFDAIIKKVSENQAKADLAEIWQEEIVNVAAKILHEFFQEKDVQVENINQENIVNLIVGEFEEVLKNTRNLQSNFHENGKYELRLLQSNREGSESSDVQEIRDLLLRGVDEFLSARFKEIKESSSTPSTEVETRSVKVPEAKNPQPEKEMQNYSEKLRQYKEYGDSISNLLKHFDPQSLPEGVPTNLSSCVQELKELASKTIERATSPIKIAIMGEVSSGKTLLAGSLIGYADALPVNEIATTGNVTAIHLTQQEEEGTTVFEQFQVQFLSQQEVKGCLEFMLQEAKKRANAVGVDCTQLEESDSSSPIDVNAEKILQWCEQAWENTNPELRYLIWELVVFLRSYTVYGKDICDKTYTIEKKTTKEGLKLTKPENISDREFSSLPPVPQKWQNLEKPSAQDLQNSFSLIRRIDVTAKISKQIWDLSSLKGSNEFVLLDLPGLGSVRSGVRDSFLSLLEIDEAQTFLLLLNGKASSPGQAALKIRTALEQRKKEDIKDRILVGVGRFNQLPLTAKHKQTIDGLIGESALTEQEVLSELDTLEQIITTAESLTNNKDRIILLSQTYALAEQAKQSRLVEVCSPEFQTQLDEANKPDSDEFKMYEKWKQLSRILEESESGSTLAKQLSDFADDGGIARLRSSLQEHVAEHGLKQLYDDTRTNAETLRKKENSLEKILKTIQDNPIPENSEDYIKLRQAIDNLRKNYGDLKEKLAKEPLLKCNGVAVSDVVKDELSFRIHRWREWALLFNSIQDGIIKPAPSSKTAASVLIKPLRKNKSIPTRSDDFYSTFENSFEQLRFFAGERIQDALEELLGTLSNSVEPYLCDLKRILRPQMLENIEKIFGDDALDSFNVLLQMPTTEPNSWLESIISQINDKVPTSSSNYQTLFPLANKDDSHEFGQIFDWSPEKQSSVSPIPFNHEFLVLRLRSEMIASNSLNLTDHVSKLIEVANDELSSFLKLFIDALAEISKNEALMNYIATANEQTKNPSWLEALLQIPSVTYPSV